MRFTHFILVFSFCLFFFACGEEEENNMYGAHVDFKIYLDAWDSELKNPGVPKRFTDPDQARGKYIGYGGLLVVSGLTIESSSTRYPIYAFDLACPHEADRKTLITINDKLEAECPKCKSTFDVFLGSGSRRSGPSKKGLETYRVINEDINRNIFRIIR